MTHTLGVSADKLLRLERFFAHSCTEICNLGEKVNYKVSSNGDMFPIVNRNTSTETEKILQISLTKPIKVSTQFCRHSSRTFINLFILFFKTLFSSVYFFSPLIRMEILISKFMKANSPALKKTNLLEYYR